MNPRLKTIFIIVVAILIVAGLSILNRPHERIPWRKDIVAAKAESLHTGQPMLLDFTADWCEPCQQMRQTTWSDSDVERELRSYVPVQIDVDQHPDVVAQYHVSGIPRIIVTDAKGAVLRSLTGGLDPEAFRKWLHSEPSGSPPLPE